MRRVLMVIAIAVFLAAGLRTQASAADWPTWRGNAQRTAVSPEALPDSLRTQWVRDLGAPAPAWPPTQMKLQFDLSYAPVVLGKTIFVPSMTSDRLAAYDTDTGVEKWRVYAEGPVRFAPVAWRDKVYFVSDDGYLYCVDAGTGALRWKVRGGPSDRKILGNGRLISTWPARGGPVLNEGTIYFAASIWPFMGTFLCAVDAETGKTVWANSGSGSIFILQQHSSPAFAGVAPQGYLAAAQDKLLVAGGRTVPAAYDLKTGQLLYYNLADRSLGRKDWGGYAAAALGDCFVNLRMPGQDEPGGALYRLADGELLAPTEATILAPEGLIGVRGNRLTAYAPEPGSADAPRKGGQGKAAQGGKAGGAARGELWSVELPGGIERAFVKAGPRVYCGGPGMVVAVELPAASTPSPSSTSSAEPPQPPASPA
ncbi:MAG: PQQ-binding-like beta-propeller repeat protein, partial [Candidatus Sumerlaeota bacterium]|nr:PQQ-binding-like beta-propeller repeat protein [Candidatus Sumerlaeota bacterium]